MDPERRPENLLGVLLDAYWTSLAHDPLPALLLTGLLSLGGVLVVGWWLHMGLAAIWVVLAAELFVRGALIYGRFLHGGWKKVEV